jgi:hypothetical protein
MGAREKYPSHEILIFHLSMMEGMIGVLYIAILMARLVSLYTQDLVEQKTVELLD